MKLKNRDISDIAEALKQLDGTKETPYVFKTGMRTIIAKRMRAASEHVQDLEKERLNIFAKHKLGKSKLNKDGDLMSADRPEETLAYNAEWKALCDSEVEIKIGLFFMSDLDVDKNKIPSTIIATLLPIINDDTPSSTEI